MENFTKQNKLFERKAEILKALAHAIRLCIVKGLLEDKACNVTKMQYSLAIPQSTISQHIAKLKSPGIIKGERDGVKINYELANEDVKRIIEVIFEKERT